jgi:hypothetical protein
VSFLPCSCLLVLNWPLASYVTTFRALHYYSLPAFGFTLHQFVVGRIFVAATFTSCTFHFFFGGFPVFSAWPVLFWHIRAALALLFPSLRNLV